MSDGSPATGRPLRPTRSTSLALLAIFGAATVLFATATDLPGWFAASVALAGVGGTAYLRTRSGAAGGPAALMPALGALVVLATAAPSTSVADLFGGLAGISLLAWLSEDPRRAPGGIGRAVPALVLVVLTVGIAWASAFLLPPGTSFVGVGGALLVAAAILVAVLLGRPDLIDREPPATA